jgi:hypothetical protein
VRRYGPLNVTLWIIRSGTAIVPSAVFNTAVERLRAQDIDPQVHPLPADHLPLHFSCPHDGTRLRLRHERRGPDHFAVTDCGCGRGFRFHLGRGAPTIRELEATGRWSIDVSLPIMHNQLASGWIAGRSSALYALVCNEVLEKVLGERPIPALVPAALAAAEGAAASGTLLLDYLTAGRVPAVRVPL